MESHFVDVNGLNLHYVEAGAGEAVLLLHGWPTSAYLWRNIMPEIAKTRRAIALDLPGFGKSAKPLDASYSFRFYTETIAAFLEQLEISELNLVVHDLGGPLGLLWAVQNPQAVLRLVLLNTLVYPQLSWAARLFVISTYIPFVKTRLSSPRGIKGAMRLGMTTRLDNEDVQAYQAPFQDSDSQKVLLKTVQRLSPKGLKEIAEKLPDFKIPVALIYGEQDRILLDVAKTMARVKGDLPQAEVTTLPDAGHFLQEDEPETLSQRIAEFLNR